MANKINYTGSSKILIRICEAINDLIDSGGGGGTSNYNDLTNKPTINNVTLSGNKTLADLGIATKTSDLTNDSNFISDSNYVHTDNNYTTSEKDKLAGLNNYTLPIASANTLGGIKVGNNLSIDSNGVLSATGGGGGGSSPLYYDNDGSICIDYDLLEVR